MIFVTVGTQLGFDRFISIVDEWAAENSGVSVFCQIADGSYLPSACKYVRSIPADEYRRYFEEADVVVSHAGMGSIITAFDYSKPLIVFPRQLKYCEHRNDHQVATVRKFRGRTGIYAAETKHDLKSLLNNWSGLDSCSQKLEVSSELVSSIVEFIET